MTRLRFHLSAALAFLALVGLAGPEAAGAHKLSARTAKARAQKVAKRQAAREGIVAWELSGPFRLDEHRLVYAWYAELPDGRGCVAQLVVRYANRTSRKTVGYFRNRECD